LAFISLSRFAGDIAEIGIIRAGEHKKVQVVLRPRVHLVQLSACTILSLLRIMPCKLITNTLLLLNRYRTILMEVSHHTL